VKLIGRYMSPFVRRVGVSLHLLDIPFTNEPLSVLTDSLKIREYSPLGRLPALVLDDGQVLIDSNAILDYFDQQAGAERALLPLSGPQRSEAMNLLAFAVGACEKTVGSWAASVVLYCARRAPGGSLSCRHHPPHPCCAVRPASIAGRIGGGERR